MENVHADGVRPTRGWPRAAGLLCVVIATGVIRPDVLVAVPLLLLLLWSGPKNFRVALAAGLAALIVASGSRDGLWFTERAWAVMVGGAFVGLSMMVPGWRVSSRALAAVVAALVVSVGVLAGQAEAWAALDGALADRVREGVEAMLYASEAFGGNQANSVRLETAAAWAADFEAAVFPALICLGSMSALGVAWWVRTRLVGEGDQGLGPLARFSFNDHLVWLFVAGLVLLVAQWGDALVRVGSNAVVFMGALYALRGAAVFMFVSGGLSLFGYVAFVVGLLVAAPALVGVAMLIGIGDTWLDIRTRIRANAA